MCACAPGWVRAWAATPLAQAERYAFNHLHFKRGEAQGHNRNTRRECPAYCAYRGAQQRDGTGACRLRRWRRQEPAVPTQRGPRHPHRAVHRSPACLQRPTPAPGEPRTRRSCWGQRPGGLADATWLLGCSKVNGNGAAREHDDQIAKVVLNTWMGERGVQMALLPRPQPHGFLQSCFVC